MNKLNYRNITISGLPGAGSSTLGKALARALRWEYFSGGDFMRAYAIEKDLFKDETRVHHCATLYPDSFDLKVDFGMRKRLEKKRSNILDSWLSGFMAQQVKGVLKILVYCPNDAIRVDRLTNRDNLTIQQAKKHIFEREKKNVGKWQKMYKKQWQEWVVKENIVTEDKKIWFWYPEMYDLCIDTYKNSKRETLRIALKELAYKRKVNFKKAFS